MIFLSCPVEITNFSSGVTQKSLIPPILYWRDIILFSGAPTPLPKDTIKDMSKMFILVKNTDEMSEKVENIDYISKKRQRHDEIIEYYSSKKCDTKDAVTKIIDNELVKW